MREVGVRKLSRPGRSMVRVAVARGLVDGGVDLL